MLQTSRWDDGLRRSLSMPRGAAKLAYGFVVPFVRGVAVRAFGPRIGEAVVAYAAGCAADGARWAGDGGDAAGHNVVCLSALCAGLQCCSAPAGGGCIAFHGIAP